MVQLPGAPTMPESAVYACCTRVSRSLASCWTCSTRASLRESIAAFWASSTSHTTMPASANSTTSAIPTTTRSRARLTGVDPSWTPCSSLRRLARSHVLRTDGANGRGGEVDGDQRATAGRVVDRDIGARAVGEVTQDRQADAGPVRADRLRVVEAVEAHEDPAAVVGGDARPLVGNAEAGAVAVVGDGDGDRRPGRRVLAGVRQQVGEDPFDGDGVGPGDDVAVDVDDELVA